MTEKDGPKEENSAVHEWQGWAFRRGGIVVIDRFLVVHGGSVLSVDVNFVALNSLVPNRPWTL